MNRLQWQRLIVRSLFFLLFILAPLLDLFRLDLNQGHFILFGYPWTLGLHEIAAGDGMATQVVINILLRVFLPVLGLIGLVVWVSWRWGRLYCSWLCPHFSVVEIINSLMRRASGKPSLWSKPLPEKQSDGTYIKPRNYYWSVTAVSVLFFAFLWAVTLLTYLLPPYEIWSNLFNFTLTRNQLVFILVATVLLTIEFTLARHLFCRFGCAVGVAQSLIWMGNRAAMVVGFDRSRSTACIDCDQSCEHACPMRLQPRQIKRKIFNCTQCAQCVQACERVQDKQGEPSLLQLVSKNCALNESERDFGHHPKTPDDCFTKGK